MQATERTTLTDSRTNGRGVQILTRPLLCATECPSASSKSDAAPPRRDPDAVLMALSGAGFTAATIWFIRAQLALAKLRNQGQERAGEGGG